MMWSAKRVLLPIALAVLPVGCSRPPALAPPSAVPASPPPPSQPPEPKGVTPVLIAGAHHNCASTGDGALECWGAGNAGQLGDGHYRDRSAPVRVLYVGKVTLAAAGTDHTCAQTAQGQLYCWGARTGGWSPPRPSYRSPLPMRMPFGPFSAMAAGKRFTCGSTEAGDVTCFGSTPHESWSFTPPELAGADHIEATGERLCVTRDGNRSCFRVDPGVPPFRRRGGQPAQPKLHADNAENAPSPLPPPDGLRPQGAIVRGRAHACAFTAAGIRCWGDGARGQLADKRPLLTKGVWTQIPMLDAQSMVAMLDDMCAVTRSGGVVCWGRGAYGKPATLERYERPGFAPAVALGANPEGAALCALLSDGRVQCDIRQPNDEETPTRPVLIPGVTHAVAVAANAESVCALDGKRRVHCRDLWDDEGPFERVPGLPAIASLHMLDSRACGLDRRQRLWCWGQGTRRASRAKFVRRRCPDGPHYRELYEVPLDGRCQHSSMAPLTGIRGLLFTGGAEMMPLFWAFTDQGGVFAYEDSDDGASIARRRKSRRQRRFLPHLEPFPLPADTVELVGGRDVGCALTARSTTHCWGEPFGAQPTAIPLPARPVQLAASQYQVCLRAANGAVYCQPLDRR